MNSVDFVIVVVIALTTFSSLRAGIIREVMTLVALIVGVYAALGHYQQLATEIGPIVGNPALSNGIAFMLILIVVWIAAALLASLVRAMLKSLGLGWTDHALGGLAGFLGGLAIAAAFVLLLTRLPIASLNRAVVESSLARYIFLVLPYLQQLLPSDLHIFEVI